MALLSIVIAFATKTKIPRFRPSRSAPRISVFGPKSANVRFWRNADQFRTGPALPGKQDRVRPDPGQTIRRGRLESRGGTDATRELSKPATWRAQKRAARRDQAGERRGDTKNPFADIFQRRARFILDVSRQKIAGFFDKARLRRPPAKGAIDPVERRGRGRAGRINRLRRRPVARPSSRRAAF
jgi:hypothetical protein